jgi:hypothetical protein
MEPCTTHSPAERHHRDGFGHTDRSHPTARYGRSGTWACAAVPVAGPVQVAAMALGLLFLGAVPGLPGDVVAQEPSGSASWADRAAAAPALSLAGERQEWEDADGRTAGWLIASAVLAAPPSLRDGAEVRAWVGDDLITLRPGSNGIICLADQPGDDRFAAACYHEGLEPFMERGRELRRDGLEATQRNHVRWAEIAAGTLPMPAAGMVYNLSFPSPDFDPATTDAATGGRLHALYIPFAAPEDTGLPVRPGDGAWLMDPGTAGAHVMMGIPPRRTD